MSGIKLYTIIALIHIFTFKLIGQGINHNGLNKKKYYDDFDTLTKWIVSVSPIYLVNDKLKNQDFLFEMKKLRSKIATISRIEDFYKIVFNSLNLVQEPHTTLSTNRSLVSPELLYPQKDTVYITESCKFYDSIRTKVIRNRDIKPILPIAYVNGKYTVYYPFTVGGAKVDTGYFISSLNGKDIDNVIKTMIPDISLLKFDLKNKISYYEDFYRLRRLYDTPDKMIHLEFIKGNKKVLVQFGKTDSVIYDRKISLIGFNQNAKSKKVTYLDSLDVLYIRMPQMSNGQFYLNELKKYYGKKPKKVIFDIRGNGGGQDWVWASALKSIICNNQIVRPVFLGARNSTIAGQLLSLLIPGGEEIKKVISPSAIPHEEFYTIQSQPENFYGADSASINYSGNIYLLCSGYEYSSTGNFIDMAVPNSKIITVGQNTGLIGGLELSPIPFILPNSKVIFNLAINIDLKGVQTVQDIYHNQVEIPVSYSLEDLYHIASQINDVSDMNFLLHRDPMFKKVLELD